MNMILNKNFRAYMGLLMFGTITYSVGTPISGNNGSLPSNYALAKIGMPMTDVNGNSYDSLTFESGSSGKISVKCNLTNYSIENKTTTTYTSFKFSSGTTETSEFTVDDEVVSGLNCTLSCMAIADSTHPMLRYTLSLTATSNVTINRIFLIKSLYKLDSGVVVSSVPFRLGAVTLDTPLALVTGESKTFDIDIIL